MVIRVLKLILYSSFVWLSYELSIDEFLDLPMTKCTQFKYDFANITSYAASCFIQFSQPLRICTNCRQELINLKGKYELLINGSIGKHRETNCAENILRSDASSSFEDIYNALADEWEDVNCDQCYKGGNFSDSFLEFLEKETYLLNCFQLYTNASLNFTDKYFDTIWDFDSFNQSACANCRSLYQDLTQYYEEVEEALPKSNKKPKYWKGLCGDLGDMMNTTRFLWSNKFQCDMGNATLIMIAPICFIIVCNLLFFCLVSTYFHNRVRTILYRPHRLKRFMNDDSLSVRESSIR